MIGFHVFPVEVFGRMCLSIKSRLSVFEVKNKASTARTKMEEQRINSEV